MFPSFDLLEDQDSLIRFFSTLAFSSESELGFDTEIERVNNSDFELRFSNKGVGYPTSGVLFDVGADATCGRGTWVFEVYEENPEDDENKVLRVVKDCWVEDCKGKHMEHEIIQEVRAAIGPEEFREHFVDCRLLKEFKTQEVQRPVRPLIWTPAAKRHTSYTKSGRALVSDQHHHLRPTSQLVNPKRLPHPRSRYQVVYTERGASLYHITSLSDTFRCLVQVMCGLLLLHKAGFVHRDISPGNIIIVDGKAKISDLEFTKARDIDQLQTLTDSSACSLLPNVADIRTGTLYFTAVEICRDTYYFREGSGDEERIILHNPLHDYESVWWIATWVVFSCRPKDLDDVIREHQKAAWGGLFGDRSTAFISDKFPRHKELPEMLHLLLHHLDEMKKTLISAYKSYEKSFDGSPMLDVVPILTPHLHDLAHAAETIEIEELTVPSTVERSTMKIEVGDGTNPPPQTLTSEAEPGTIDLFRSRVRVVESTLIKGKRGRSFSPGNPNAKRQMVDA
ncbi:hypothetical protein BDM02DRAFT_3193080 [Thelephora ganbajun]|uniref:Uncharacterized protein n=1 Tax=Thelephora ganbajun TaxID=370292 RepID=A0ACB6Z076_THEGA|nr:hypothetical protein BDM02DRAFT_3193080 [Thelephora ganbajun]